MMSKRKENHLINIIVNKTFVLYFDIVSQYFFKILSQVQGIQKN